MAPQRVFVTGGGGFVGAHVLRALSSAGYAATALVRDPSRCAAIAALPGVSLCAGDLTEPGAWRDHLAGHAACVHLALVWGAPEDDLDLRDVRATAKLFEAAAERGVGHLVYTSSVAVHRPYAPRMDATHPVGGGDYYGATKASGEAFLAAVSRRYGVRGNVLRPGAVVGPPALAGASVRLDRRVAGMLASARRGETLRVRAGEGRPFVGAADLARLYVALLQSDVRDGRFVAVAPEVLAWSEVAALAVEVAGRGSVEVEDGPLDPPGVFDVSATEEALGALASPRTALREALVHCLREPPSDG